MSHKNEGPSSCPSLNLGFHMHPSPSALASLYWGLSALNYKWRHPHPLDGIFVKTRLARSIINLSFGSHPEKGFFQEIYPGLLPRPNLKCVSFLGRNHHSYREHYLWLVDVFHVQQIENSKMVRWSWFFFTPFTMSARKPVHNIYYFLNAVKTSCVLALIYALADTRWTHGLSLAFLQVMPCIHMMFYASGMPELVKLWKKKTLINKSLACFLMSYRLWE